MEKVISVKNLTKKYGDLVAVNDISFEVTKGEIFGLLGENGAGKTTTLEMIEGLRRPSSGEIKVLDCDIVEHRDSVKERIGVQLQSSAYYQFLTLKEILELFGSFYAKNISADELLKMVELESKSDSLIGSLSGGQRQRFSIVASLVNDPEVVFLDEPTTGLDPIARRNLWDLIVKIKSQGKTVILTTHYMEEAEILCDRVAIMETGKILVMDETHKLIEQAKFPFTITFIDKQIDEKNLAELKKLAEIENVFGKESKYTLKIKNQASLNAALKIVQSIAPESLTVGRATLEDLFIELTGKQIEE
jgi:ABC-2 type transport system ATP-binding protein